MSGKEIGHRMAALRKKRNLTRRELARFTGLSQGQLSRLENGRQGFRSQTLLRIAKALDVEPYRLLLPTKSEGNEGLIPRLDGALVEALRDPGFVSVLEAIAAARFDSPAKYQAIESVMATVVGR